MPDRKRLKVGDRIRLLCVPARDLEQRERERREGLEDAGWTADTIERILAQDPVVTIVEIDEYANPWFRYDLRRADGRLEEHSLAIMEDESWERAWAGDREDRMAVKLECVQPVLMSRDVEVSIRFFRLLGFVERFRDDPANVRYAGVARDGVELHLQWHDAREWEFPNDRPTYRFVVGDVDALFEEFRGRGALGDATGVRDTPWGTREFHVRDPDGNGLQFYRRL